MQSGQQIRDYVLEDRIGVGGMGQVWRARHLYLHRRVAIKALTAELAIDPEFEQRFIREARAQANLQHPRILGVNEFFVHDDIYYLVMPLVEGESLEVLLDRAKGPLPLDRVLSIARDILDALDYANQRGIVHRDVKPSNILLDSDGRAYLMDFGIALLLGEDRKTRTGTSLGTPHYMSPEQILHPKAVDHRTDVYSVGCVLYEALTGRPPFLPAQEGDTDYQIKHAHLYSQPASIRSLNPAVPDAVARVVMRALVKDPDLRLPGCGEFLRALQTPHLPVSFPPSRPEPPQPPPPRRRRLWLALGAGAGCLVLAAVAVVAVMIVVRSLEPSQPPMPDFTADEDDADGEPTATTPRPVPEPYRSRLLQQLEGRGTYYEARGFRSTFNPYLDRLDSGKTDWLYFDLSPEVHYKILGVCDADCTDLDFEIQDDARETLDVDSMTDAIPVVDVVPPAAGRYHLKVDMKACSTNPCYYAVDIYETP